MDQATNDDALRNVVDAIVDDDRTAFAVLLERDAALATARYTCGASRAGRSPDRFFIAAIGYAIYAGDTALHFAAAAYRTTMASELIRAGADVRAKNRRGTEPLHAASVGNPASARWDPSAQAATIVALIAAGADPNARNMDGVTPLHRAVRTRCAGAVRALLDHGADPMLRTKNGSAAKDLARFTTGRGGSGTAEAKAQQQAIASLLEGR